MLSKLWQFINRDLAGREEVLESTHFYFGKVIYFGKKGQEGYWEAELPKPGSDDKFSIIIPAAKEASLDPYARLAAVLTADMDGLLAKCRHAFAAEWPHWCDGPFPAHWRESFELDGISLPAQADESNEWSICYFVKPANHYFTAVLMGSTVHEVIVDG